MFIAEALADFSKQILMLAQESQNQQQPSSPKNDEVEANQGGQIQNNQQDNQNQEGQDDPAEKDEEEASLKRQRPKDLNEQLEKLAQQEQGENVLQSQRKQENSNQEDEEKITYTSFISGEKILVKQTFENGWWLGHPIKKPELEGFFPSNYVKVGVQPPPPSSQKTEKKQKKEVVEEGVEFDPREGKDWMKTELDKVSSGPITSDYYQGIKGYKTIRIDEKNQNVLKGNYVQYDVATGLAKVPVKDQAPTAKAVRQMGYYFDYHQWNEQRNSGPQVKARPDPRKKKAKKLNLKMMDRD